MDSDWIAPERGQDETATDGRDDPDNQAEQHEKRNFQIARQGRVYSEADVSQCLRIR